MVLLRAHNYPVKQTLTLRFFLQAAGSPSGVGYNNRLYPWRNRLTTRPITMSNAAAYVSEPLEMALVLNTPFLHLAYLWETFWWKDSISFPEEELDSVYTPPTQKGYDILRVSGKQNRP